MTVRGGDRVSFAMTQALAHNRQKWRQGELCHDPSPYPWPSEVETGRALPWPKPLPMTVRGGDSWCSIHQCSVPSTPERVKGLVIMIMYKHHFPGKGKQILSVFSRPSAVCEYYSIRATASIWRTVLCATHKDWKSQTAITHMVRDLFVGCLMSQQHVSVSQGRICSDNFPCCHRDSSYRSNFLPHPVTIYWHQADQPQTVLGQKCVKLLSTSMAKTRSNVYLLGSIPRHLWPTLVLTLIHYRVVALLQVKKHLQHDHCITCLSLNESDMRRTIFGFHNKYLARRG